MFKDEKTRKKRGKDIENTSSTLSLYSTFNAPQKKKVFHNAALRKNNRYLSNIVWQILFVLSEKYKKISKKYILY